MGLREAIQEVTVQVTPPSQVDILATVVADNRASTLVRTLELIQTHLRVIDLVRTFEHAR
jgi:hypothetical protein